MEFVYIPIIVFQICKILHVCYRCDIASCNISSSYKKHKEDRREKREDSLFDTHSKLQHVKTLAS
jgi:hypothetical protein